MKQFRSVLAAGLFLLCFPLIARAEWTPEPALQAQAYYLVNLETGVVVSRKNDSEVRSPASLTKMMTALLLLESGEDLDRTITIPERLRGEFEQIQIDNGSDADLKIGEEITLRDLLYCALLPSGNDAASVIADYLSDGDMDAFVRQMNLRAAELGCQNTAFSCAHGLYEGGDGNWSTAYDMALIARACYEQPVYMEIACTAPYYWLPLSNMHSTVRTYADGETAPAGCSYRIYNTNIMQWPDDPLYRPYIRGLKTGFTDLAGKCFATVAEQDGESYLLVMMGEPNTYDEEQNARIYLDTAALLDWTLERFQPGDLAEAGQFVTSVPVANSKDGDEVPLCLGEDVYTLVDTDGQPSFSWTLDDQELRAPVHAGDVVGTVEVWQNDECVATVPLQAAEDRQYGLLKHIASAFSALF